MASTIADAFLILFRVFVVYVIYSAAKHFASQAKCTKARAYLWAIGISLLLAAVSWANYGTHTENDDPLFGGGEIVTDFGPTDDQRNRHGLLIFTVLGVTSIVGTYQGLKQRKYQEI